MPNNEIRYPLTHAMYDKKTKLLLIANMFDSLVYNETNPTQEFLNQPIISLAMNDEES
jgi:hypothetical protein